MLVLLDLDGTLIDPYDGITRCVRHALDALGHPAPPDLRSFIGPPLQESFAALGVPDVDRAVALYRKRFTGVGLYEHVLYDGVRPALTALVGAGLPLALATSKPEPFAVRILEHQGLLPLFDAVAGATLDGSRRSKADVVGHALRQIGVPGSDAVMVGDRVQDVDGARAHGVRSIGVRWGYAEPGELAGADALVSTPAALVALLLA
ncbi:MAG: family hydrolase [Frankiales bacterium]|nr:family hydrolase [Frankiales bacterium]